jgi:SMODS-associated and fused to various effectors sensor domain
VSDDVLADVTLTHVPPIEPSVGLIRSQADVDLVRFEFRRLFARVRNTRPNIYTIHLFVAAPPSICLAIGQELSLHNSPAVQTYRYRKAQSQGSQQPAILLQSAVDQMVLAPLTDHDLHTAGRVRKIWGGALQDVEYYVRNKSADGTPNTGRT